jgi:hypothetical protein
LEIAGSKDCTWPSAAELPDLLSLADLSDSAGGAGFSLRGGFSPAEL